MKITCCWMGTNAILITHGRYNRPEEDDAGEFPGHTGDQAESGKDGTDCVSQLPCRLCGSWPQFPGQTELFPGQGEGGDLLIR